MDNKGSWCQVWGPDGKPIAFNPLDPQPDMINIETIAHALSMQCRFIGHVKKFFSVASHCVYVSRFCNEEDALWGLLHDASEAFLVDIPRPQKRSEELAGYMKLEAKIMKVILEVFKLPPEMPQSVLVADDLLLQWEIRDNLQQPIIQEIFPQYLGTLDDAYAELVTDKYPGEAEQEFLNRYHQLVRRG